MLHASLPTLEEMLEAGVHFGHQTNKWHPAMKKYIFGEREGIHIINLDDTHAKLNEALEYISSHVTNGKKDGIVLIGTKRQAAPVVKDKAVSVGVHYIINRWPGGLITNFKEITKAIGHYNELCAKINDHTEFEKHSTRDRFAILKEKTKRGEIFGGISTLTAPPSLLVIVDPRREKTALNEARLKGIPTIGIVDTNTNPGLVDFPIPANDDALKSIELIIGALSNAIGSVGEDKEKKPATKKKAVKKVATEAVA